MKEWAISETKFEMNKDSSGAAAWAVFYKNLNKPSRISCYRQPWQ